LAHAYSAFAVSPFSKSAVLVVDEQGHHVGTDKFEKCSWFVGDGNKLKSVASFFGGGDDLSLGMFYDAFAALLGLSEAGMPSGGKLMALAAHGHPRTDWPSLVECLSDGDTSISLKCLAAFFESVGLRIRQNIRVNTLDDLYLKFQPIWHEEQLAKDLAWKAQDELRIALVHIAQNLKEKTAASYLCYAGGVALNCVANRHLMQTGWSDIFVQPAATDDGIALGLAYYG
jgi:carbamoyltransferase